MQFLGLQCIGRSPKLPSVGFEIGWIETSSRIAQCGDVICKCGGDVSECSRVSRVSRSQRISLPKRTRLQDYLAGLFKGGTGDVVG